MLLIIVKTENHSFLSHVFFSPSKSCIAIFQQRKVKHIIVCGHYDCGGVRAAMGNHDHGLIENWIMAVKDVARLHRKELKVGEGAQDVHWYTVLYLSGVNIYARNTAVPP